MWCKLQPLANCCTVSAFPLHRSSSFRGDTGFRPTERSAPKPIRTTDCGKGRLRDQTRNSSGKKKRVQHRSVIHSPRRCFWRTCRTSGRRKHARKSTPSIMVELAFAIQVTFLFSGIPVGTESQAVAQFVTTITHCTGRPEGSHSELPRWLHMNLMLDA